MAALWSADRALGRRCLVLATATSLVAILVSASPVHAVITSNVNVNTGNVRAVMPVTGLGIHTSPYYNNMSHSLADDRLNEAGITTLRFGGGGYADVFHWSVGRSGSGITGNGMSPWWGQPGNFGYTGPGSDFGSFVRLLDQVNNGQAVVTVNYGSAMKIVGNQSQVPDFGGQPKEAAAWVAYANADASIYGTENDITIGVDEQGNDWKTAGYWARLRASTAAEYQTWATADGVFNARNSFLAINRPEPIGIKYWEIGNETFGTAYYDTSPTATGYSVDYDLAYGTDRRGHPALSPAQYGQDVVEYSQLMKSIDPTIKIGAVLSTPPDDWSWDYYPKAGGPNNANNKHWNPEVLAVAKDDIDFVMVHWYPYIGETYTDSNSNGMHDAGETVNNGATLLDMPRQKLGPMINGTGTHTGQNAGLRDWLAAYGIPNAEIMVTEFNYFGEVWGGGPNNPTNFRTPTKALFVAESYAQWLDLGVTSVQFLEMITQNGDFLSDAGGTLTRGPAFHAISMVNQFAQPGDELVNSTSSHNNVRVHTSVRADGSVAVMVLNMHVSETADVNINITGLDLESEGFLYTLTGGTTLTGPAPVAGLGNSFSVSVAPRSISTYIIPQAPPILAGDYNDDGVVDAGDYVRWRNALAGMGTLENETVSEDVVDELDYAEWKANYGNPGGGGSLSVPEPAALMPLVLAAIGLPARLGRRSFAGGRQIA